MPMPAAPAAVITAAAITMILRNLSSNSTCAALSASAIDRADQMTLVSSSVTLNPYGNAGRTSPISSTRIIASYNAPPPNKEPAHAGG